MEYKCHVVPIQKVPIGPHGVIEPLCNNCCNRECTNPVERRSVSILGVVRTDRVYVRGSDLGFVVACPEGYIPPEEDDGEEGDSSGLAEVQETD